MGAFWKYTVILLLSSNVYGQSLAVMGSIASSGGEITPPIFAGLHPMTHDQTYYIHPNVADNDSVGRVHYLPTDTCYNNRTGDYACSIIGGDPGAEFAINSSTGMLRINDAASISGDYTLSIEFTNGTAKDTSSCEVMYLTGTEGADLLYFDLSLGSGGSGTWLDKYGDLTPINNYGEIEEGDKIFIGRGSRTTVPSGSIGIGLDVMGGPPVYIAAYGTGAKPILEPSADNTEIIRLGVYYDWMQTDGTQEGDSVRISDIRFVSNWGYEDVIALRTMYYSDGHEFHRIEVDSVTDGNGAIYLNGNCNVSSNIKIWDIKVSNTSNLGGGIPANRGLKSEAHGIEVEGATFINMARTAFECGQFDYAWGSVKYAYGQATPGTTFDAPMFQMRAEDSDFWWIVSKGFSWALEIKNYDYNSLEAVGCGEDAPHPRRIHVNHMMSFGNKIGIKFGNSTEEDLTTVSDFDEVLIENIYIEAPTSYGMYIYDWAKPIYYTDVILNNFLIPNCGTYGLQVDYYADVISVKFQNGIVYGSTNNDIHSTGINLAFDVTNVIYETISSLTHFDMTTNYDYDVADPFTDAANGDYTTADGITAVINQGTDTSTPMDIINNDNNVKDIGPFEKDGTEYNWTNR